MIADNIWVSTGLKAEAPITSKAEYGQVLAGTLGKAFSDGKLTIDKIVEVPSNRVLVRFTATAKHISSLML